MKSTVVVTKLLMLCAVVWSVPVRAAYMNDGSSTYAETWATNLGVYGYGNIHAGLRIHEYAVDVTVTSPKGRVAGGTGMLGGLGEDVTNEGLLYWDDTDLGDYSIAVNFRGWCSVAKVAFTLVTTFLTAKAGVATTTFTDPADGQPFGFCLYLSHACSSGAPTCASGNAIDWGLSCPTYMKVNFVTYTYLFNTSCFPIGLGSAQTKPGPCT